ncbi:DMT family transporter [Rivibacter subsaxonicus]|uniref:EamA-like transporter family protein n=1 Tax=Rivibacter subsaxonicus TaxID=457575 RepID=A0A4Q7W0M9_9BURK|nr:DMT family transporter [Rivibacter subsaxonicus]RZU02737.1 EamA-like transporter family protein [Rivibacter subsaxonicus]
MGLLLAVVGAIAFSGKAIVAKLMYRHGVDAITVLGLRMLLALPAFLLMAWWGGRGQPALSAAQWRMVALLGFTGYYLASLLDFAGLQFISASLERLILYLNPTLVLLIGVLRFGHRVSARQLVAMATSYAGILLVFGHELASTPAGGPGATTALGAGLVFASALSYAIYLAYGGELVKALGSLRLVGLASTVACALAITQFLVLRTEVLGAIPSPVWWLSVLNASLCTVLPVLAVMMAIERLGAPLAAQAGMIGPLATLLMGAVFLGEPLNAWIGAGTLLVLAGVALLARAR